MRRHEPLDPTVAAELEALDAALRDEPSDRELDLIVAEARAQRPEMTSAFAARLDEVAAGDSAQRAPRARTRAAWLRTWSPALGLGAACAVALVVVVGRGDGGGTVVPSRPSAPSGARKSAPPSEPVAGDRASAGTATSGAEALAAPAAPSAVTAPIRRVERSTELALTAPPRELQATADRVVQVVDRVGGYVQGSQVDATGRGGQATFDLRVPSSRLAEAVAALSRLGHVRSRSDHTQDITALFTSARSRLRDARAERLGLLKALAAADTTTEIESLKARLRIVRGRIASARRDLSSARRRADYTRVSVLLTAERRSSGTGAERTKPWTPGRALRDAGRVLSVAAGVLIVAAAGALPAALLALPALLAARAVRRRRREAALGTGAPAL